MTDSVTTVSHPRFGQVRKIMIDEAWYYIAKDVAHAVGYSDTTHAIEKHCRDNVFYHPVTDSLGRINNYRMLGSADVVRLAAAAYGDNADEFTDWLFVQEETENTDIILLHEENDKYPVRGRELHQRLEISTPYTMWFKRMCEYGFEAGKDFQTDNKNVIRADGTVMPQKQDDHSLTISMAKEICMLQRSEQGRIIRRHLIAVEEAWNSPDAVINRALKISNARVASLMSDVNKLENKIALDAPKVFFADSVTSSSTDIHVGELAKILKQNGFDTGRTRLFELLRKDGFIMKAQSGEYNTPTQKSMNMGLMRIEEQTYTVPGEAPRIRKIPLITGKGQLYFVQRYAGVRA